MRTEDQVDARNRPCQREVVVEMFVSDHDHDVGMLFLAQVPHGIAGRGNRVIEMQHRLLDERLEVAAGDRKHADANPVDDKDP